LRTARFTPFPGPATARKLPRSRAPGTSWEPLPGSEKNRPTSAG
jgi:hypothetical protein